MSIPDANGWLPIEQASTGDYILWVADYGGHSAFGRVFVYADGHRVVTAEGHTGEWNITHFQPRPKPPVQP